MRRGSIAYDPGHFTDVSSQHRRRAPQTQFASLTGTDNRDTIGGRVWGAVGSFKYDGDLAYQWGTFETAPRSRTVSAVGTSTRLLYEFEETPLKPAAQLQVSYFSGSHDPRHGTLGTFSAPFQRPTLLSRATPLTQTLNNDARYIGTNLVATAQWSLVRNVTLFAEYVREYAGGAIARAGGRGADVGVIQVDFNF